MIVLSFATNRSQIILYFFQKLFQPLDLHSFPTRRSSDLPWAKLCAAPDQQRRAQLRGEGLLREAVPAAAGRSEEHTSEIQSREKHVYRLLLEKQKSPSWFRRQTADRERRHYAGYNSNFGF